MADKPLSAFKGAICPPTHMDLTDENFHRYTGGHRQEVDPD
jgi:hypothetical protein